MRLVAGARLGPYEIQSAIGAGGMGEVYRARDARLDRTVAIKIYYLSEDGNLVAVAAALGQTPSFGVPQTLFRTRVHPGVHALRTHYVPSGDGSRFLIQTRSDDPVPAPITVVLNWNATR